MPTVYRIDDGSGLSDPRMDRALAAAVTFDGKDTGQIMRGEYVALLIGGKIVPLPHPVEWSTLREHHEGFLSASLKGILLSVERRICISCGNIFDAPRVTFPPSAGCLPAMGVALVVFTYHLLGRGAHFPAAVGSAILVLLIATFIIPLVGSFYVRIAFSKRQRHISQRRCPQCGGGQSRAIANCTGKPIEIGGGGRRITITIAGKS